jgi:hypothetical protein
VPGTAAADDPLTTFQRNFCATEPVVTPEAGSLHRTAMTQPGVYFALDAPFVRILGLFSNALEDPGVISSQGGQWKTVPDSQLGFLSAQLARAKAESYAGALLIAVHHPPFNYAPAAGGGGAGGTHGGNPAMLADIDRACAAAGMYPHAVLAGHAHNYQRYTRSLQFAGAEYQVPFLVCGGGGHNVDPLVRAHLGEAGSEPPDGADVSYLDAKPVVRSTGLVLDRHDDHDFGYLRAVATSTTLTLTFYPVDPARPVAPASDSVTVDLASHRVVATSPGNVATARGRAPAPRRRRSRQRGRAAPSTDARNSETIS